MKPSSLIAVDTIDLAEAAEKIRRTNPAVADLLAAVAEVDEDSLHSMAEWPSGETECIDDCTPCAAKYAAQVVAIQYLRAMVKAAAA